MNTPEIRKTTSCKPGGLLPRRAVALALPLGMAAAFAAMPASAAEEVVDGSLNNANHLKSLSALSVPLKSDGAEISLGDEAQDPESSSTGPLEGQISLLGDPISGASQIVGGSMYNPVGEHGDFGEVRVSSLHSDATPAEAAEGCVLVFEIEHLPGAEEDGPVTLQTDPIEFTVVEATDVKAFPPVNQTYTLQEPVKLYAQGGSDPSNEPIGTLDGFDVIVNQSA